MVEVLEIPKEVGRLIHLRYLRIRVPGIKHVPSSICNLLNLQTLDMRESSLSNLPNEIWKLQQLRHLNLFHLRSLLELWGTDEKSLEPPNLVLHASPERNEAPHGQGQVT